jgi:hypothetical protein
MARRPRRGPRAVCEVTGVVDRELPGALRALGGGPPGRACSNAEFAVRTRVAVLPLVQLKGGLNVRRVRVREWEGCGHCQAHSDAGTASVGTVLTPGRRLAPAEMCACRRICGVLPARRDVDF